MMAAASATAEATVETAAEATVETAADGTVEAALGFESVAVRSVEIAEAMVPAVAESTVKERRSVNGERGVETPAERAIENTRAGNEGVGSEPGIPIPAGPIPPGATIHVQARGVGIRFGQIAGTQARPAKEVIGVLLVVKALRFWLCAASESDFVIVTHADGAVAGEHIGFALEDADLIMIGVEVIQAAFQ